MRFNIPMNNVMIDTANIFLEMLSRVNNFREKKHFESFIFRAFSEKKILRKGKEIGEPKFCMNATLLSLHPNN